jgi:hypothetical protein
MLDQRTSREALRESEKKYGSLGSRTGEGFIVCEVVRNDVGRALDLTYLELNRAVGHQTAVDRQTFWPDGSPSYSLKPTSSD